MSLADNKAHVRRWIEEGWNQDENIELDYVRLIFADDWKDLNPLPGEPAGVEGAHYFVMLYRTAFPDIRLTIERMMAEDNQVAFSWTARGTHQGPLGKVAPTGKSVTVTGITWHWLADGKIVQSYGETDVMGLMQQLGAIT